VSIFRRGFEAGRQEGNKESESPWQARKLAAGGRRLTLVAAAAGRKE